MARKTQNVAELTKWVNVRLQTPESTLSDLLKDMTPEQAFRFGQASLLEQVLHATGNYKGWNIPASERNDDGTTRDGADETRRFYYL